MRFSRLPVAISLIVLGLALAILAFVFFIIGFTPFTKVPIVATVILLLGVISLIAGLLRCPEIKHRPDSLILEKIKTPYFLISAGFFIVMLNKTVKGLFKLGDRLKTLPHDL